MIKPPKLKKVEYVANSIEKTEIPINYKGGPIEDQEKFELGFLKHETVEIKPLPKTPEGNIVEILNYLSSIVDGDYDMISVGKAFDLARINIRKIILQSDYMWEMSKYANQYQRQKPNLGLNQRDKKDLLERIRIWINEIEEEKRKKKEEEEIQRKIQEEMKAKELEKARLEKERIEKARLEKERLEKERIEKARLEKERIEKAKARIEKAKQLEKEVLVKTTVEKEKLEKVETPEILENQIMQVEQQLNDLKNIKPVDKKARKENKKAIKNLKKELKKLKKSLKKKKKGKK